MADQLKKRTSQKWVEYVLGQFNDYAFSERQACQLLEIKRSQLYDLRKRWLKAHIVKKLFRLQSSGQNQKHSLPDNIQDFLHGELSYIRKEAYYYRGRFNFAYLSEKVLQKFGLSLHRNTIRRFAIKEGYYHRFQKRKKSLVYASRWTLLGHFSSMTRPAMCGFL